MPCMDMLPPVNTEDEVGPKRPSPPHPPTSPRCITTTAQDDHELEVTERPPEAPPMEAQEP